MNGNYYTNSQVLTLNRGFETNLKSIIYHIIKRGFDVVASSMGLLFLSPLFLGIIAAIRLTSKGNAIYKHKRIGKNGEFIYLYKFRSMVSDANDFDKYFTKEQKEEYFKNFKLDDDPRITKIGKFLRKSSLDELPQLLNILKGDMSFVGPRPVVEKEIQNFGIYQSTLVRVLPGLTGYWASHGRSNTTYDERVNMEVYYVRNCSLKLDIQILFKTFKEVLLRNGAK